MSVAFNLSFDWQEVFLLWVGFSSQFAGLSDGVKRDCDLLNSGSLSMTVVAIQIQLIPDPRTCLIPTPHGTTKNNE
jgi:hypothetical protein